MQHNIRPIAGIAKKKTKKRTHLTYRKYLLCLCNILQTFNWKLFNLSMYVYSYKSEDTVYGLK